MNKDKRDIESFHLENLKDYEIESYNEGAYGRVLSFLLR